jgi:hypothetical protein
MCWVLKASYDRATPNLITSQDVMRHEEWDPPMSFGVDFLWLLEDNIFGGLEDLGMDFGGGF